MRLDINLASQPYEDARQFWMRWGTATVMVGLLTLILLTMTVRGWMFASQDRKAMAATQALIADRVRIRTDAANFLNRPGNRNTRDMSQFLNQLIERKAFCWTRVLESLEKVMPPRVHLVAINPQLSEDNQLGLKMTIAGDSQERGIELAQRMGESGRFSQTWITDVRSTQSTTGDRMQMDLVATYIPEKSAASVPDQKTDAKPKNEMPKGSKR